MLDFAFAYAFAFAGNLMALLAGAFLARGLARQFKQLTHRLTVEADDLKERQDDLRIDMNDRHSTVYRDLALLRKEIQAVALQKAEIQNQNWDRLRELHTQRKEFLEQLGDHRARIKDLETAAAADWDEPLYDSAMESIERRMLALGVRLASAPLSRHQAEADLPPQLWLHQPKAADLDAEAEAGSTWQVDARAAFEELIAAEGGPWRYERSGLGTWRIHTRSGQRSLCDSVRDRDKPA